jgi:drug/metabolite transporter (DMT)-like permease
MFRSATSAGVLFALGAALAFGMSTPLVHRFGVGVGPLATACLLYTGSAVVAFLALLMPTRTGTEARVRAKHTARIVLVALAGAVVAPTALAWGLQHADATSASLVLNFEAVFTVILARLFFAEAIGRRIWAAVLLMAAGGFLLTFGMKSQASVEGWGLGAVLVSTLAWAADNTLTRPLSELDPTGVIARKSTLGALFTAALALLAREPFPSAQSTMGLIACGATGYGMSLRLYMLAQRRIGAARTGSVFAVAPFVGALAAWLLGDGRLDASSLGAAALFALAVYLHLSEQHAHTHTHDAVEHEHAHRHDDGHHDHVHVPPVSGLHSHVHVHGALTHEHEHAPDVHHDHRH